MTTDVCVPISALADCIAAAQADIAELGLTAPIVGHVGDGNFHTCVLVDPDDPDDVARAEEFHDRLVERALAHDGTCTGEHGVGYGKSRFLVAEHGAAAVEMMRAIKRALDPDGIFNPGKVAAVIDDLLQALARYDSPTLANAIETFDIQSRDVGFADNRVKCMFPELGRMVGYAATATIVARGAPGPDWAGAGNEPLYDYVRTIPAPRVVVVKDLDDPPAHGSLWGEVHATIFGALGCVGCVTDGSVRDFDEARGMGFHFFAAGPSVSHAYVRVETIGDTGRDRRPDDRARRPAPRRPARRAEDPAGDRRASSRRPPTG